MCAGLIALLLRQEEAPQQRLHSHDVEVIAGNQLSPDALGVFSFPEAQRVVLIGQGNRGKLQIVPVVAKVGIGDVEALVVRLFRLEYVKPVAVAGPGQRAQQNHVEPAKDDSADGDSQGQRKDRSGRESRFGTQAAKTVAQVLKKIPHNCSARHTGTWNAKSDAKSIFMKAQGHEGTVCSFAGVSFAKSHSPTH